MNNKNLIDNYRPNIGIALFNNDGRVWYGRRTGGAAMPSCWQMPQGGIDEEEDPIVAAARELAEETGIASAQLLTITPGWLAYDFPAEEKRKGWKGQRQKWAAMLFQGSDSEINLQASADQEFDAWRWGELEEAVSLIVPFKRNVYAEVVTAFTPLRDFLRSGL